MKAHNAAILVTVAVAGWFWAAWLYEINQYRTATSAITLTLQSRGLEDVRVWKSADDCYTFNARKGYKLITEEICL